MRAKVITFFLLKYYKFLAHWIVMPLNLRKHYQNVAQHPPKLNRRLPVKQKRVKNRLLEMAEAQYDAKKHIYKLNEDNRTSFAK